MLIDKEAVIKEIDKRVEGLLSLVKSWADDEANSLNELRHFITDLPAAEEVERWATWFMDVPCEVFESKADAESYVTRLENANRALENRATELSLRVAELEKENARLVPESIQCHERNDELVAEHLAIRKEIEQLKHGDDPNISCNGCNQVAIGFNIRTNSMVHEDGIFEVCMHTCSFAGDDECTLKLDRWHRGFQCPTDKCPGPGIYDLIRRADK